MMIHGKIKCAVAKPVEIEKLSATIREASRQVDNLIVALIRIGGPKVDGCPFRSHDVDGEQAPADRRYSQIGSFVYRLLDNHRGVTNVAPINIGAHEFSEANPFLRSLTDTSISNRLYDARAPRCEVMSPKRI